MERPNVDAGVSYYGEWRSVKCLIRMPNDEIRLARLVVEAEEGEETDVYWQVDNQSNYWIGVGEVNGWCELAECMRYGVTWRGTEQAFVLARDTAMHWRWRHDAPDAICFEFGTRMMPRGLPVDVLGKRLDGRILIEAVRDGEPYRAVVSWRCLSPL